MTESRFNRLAQLMSQHKINTIALNAGPTLTYLTGLEFHLMERPTVLLYQRGHKPLMILPRLEMIKLENVRFPMHRIPFDDDPATWLDAFKAAFKHMNLEGSRIGVESTRLRFLELTYLQQAAPTSTFVPGEQILGDLRSIKEDSEIKEMQRAVQVAQEALKSILPMIKEGISEKRSLQC